MEPEDDSGFPPGYCHHPKYEPEYFKGLCAETRIMRLDGSTYWRTDGRNEPLDCHVMNLAAAELCSGKFTEEVWRELERRREESARAESGEAPQLPEPVAVSPEASAIAAQRAWEAVDRQAGIHPPQRPQFRAPIKRPIRGRFL